MRIVFAEMDPRIERMLTNKIGSLQRIIETFVKDIGFDFPKFYSETFSDTRHATTRKITQENQVASLPDEIIVRKIRELYYKNKVIGVNCSDPFNTLPNSNSRLELFEFLKDRNKIASSLDTDQNDGATESTDSKKEKEASKLELLKLERDKKRRRKRFKTKHGNITLMDKHRDLVNNILEGVQIPLVGSGNEEQSQTSQCKEMGELRQSRSSNLEEEVENNKRRKVQEHEDLTIYDCSR